MLTSYRLLSNHKHREVLIDFTKPMTAHDLRRQIQINTDERSLTLIHLYQLDILNQHPDVRLCLLEKEIGFIKRAILKHCDILLLEEYPEVKLHKFSVSLFKKEEGAVCRHKLLGIHSAISSLSVLKSVIIINDSLKHGLSYHASFQTFLKNSLYKLSTLTLPQLKFCLLQEIKNPSPTLSEMIFATKQIESLQLLLKENAVITAALGVLIELRATATAALKSYNR